MRNSITSELVRKKELGRSRDKAEVSTQGLKSTKGTHQESRYEIRPQLGDTGPQKFLAK